MPRKEKTVTYKFPFFVSCCEYTLKKDLIDNLTLCALGKSLKGIRITYNEDTDRYSVTLKQGRSVVRSITLDSQPRIACREMLSIFEENTSLSCPSMSRGHDTDKHDSDADVHDDSTVSWKTIQTTDMGRLALEDYFRRKHLNDDDLVHAVRLVMVASFTNTIRDNKVVIKELTTEKGYRIKNIEGVDIIDGKAVLSSANIIRDRKVQQSKSNINYTDLTKPIIDILDGDR